MKSRRYQLRKDAVAIIERGHPWIFRDQLSSAAHVFADGDRLRLVDGANRVIAHGIFEAEGAIAIRVTRRGTAPPDAAWLCAQLRAALAKRAELARTTDGIRLLHGESDGVPAVVVDRFGDTLVVASYSAGADAIARYVARALPAIDRDMVGPAAHLLLRPARRRRGPPQVARALRGSMPEVARFREDGLAYAVDLAAGHKTGAYLDLRGLRRALAGADLRNARILNLYGYTGMLARAWEAAGAAEITSVDASQRALTFAAQHHVVDASRHRFVEANIFQWLPALPPEDAYDLVIIDPPSMTSRIDQVSSVLAAYRKLYTTARAHVRPGGALIAACCTSRVTRADFRRTVRAALGPDFTVERELPAEPDHPVTFRESDYLKIIWWRRTAGDTSPGDEPRGEA